MAYPDTTEMRLSANCDIATLQCPIEHSGAKKQLQFAGILRKEEPLELLTQNGCLLDL